MRSCLLTVLLLTAVNSSAQSTVKEWNFDSGQLGVSMQTKDLLLDPNLQFEGSGSIRVALPAGSNDPYIRLLNAGIDADKSNLIKVKGRNSTGGSAWRLYFKPKGGSERGNSVPFKMPRPVEYPADWTDRDFEVTVDMSRDPNWKGMIESIRIDLTEGSVGGEAWIDYIHALESESKNEQNDIVQSKFTAVDDAFIRSGVHADTNYGSDSIIVIKKANGNFERKGLIRFSVVTDVQRPVQNATLRLFYNDGNRDVKNGLVDAALYGIDHDWDELDVTYNSAPAFKDLLGEFETAVRVLDEDGEWIEIDVTDYYNTTNGVKLAFGIENITGGGRTNWSFTSSESDYAAELILSHVELNPNELCIDYTGNRKLQELELSGAQCIDVPQGLSLQDIAIADSDNNPSCNIRGVVSDEAGNTHAIDKDWESFSGFTGSTLSFQVNNNCNVLKLRVRPSN